MTVATHGSSMDGGRCVLATACSHNPGRPGLARAANLWSNGLGRAVPGLEVSRWMRGVSKDTSAVDRPRVQTPRVITGPRHPVPARGHVSPTELFTPETVPSVFPKQPASFPVCSGVSQAPWTRDAPNRVPHPRPDTFLLLCPCGWHRHPPSSSSQTPGFIFCC